MSLHQWNILNHYNNELSRADRQLKECMDLIKSRKSTTAKTIADYPKIHEYLSNKFPKIDLSDVNVFVATPGTFKKVGWSDIGGCYVMKYNTIFVKSKIVLHRTSNTKFMKLLHARAGGKIDTEDVLVHEFIHAVSSKSNRSACAFRHMEEEFVYTNCVDFYKSKGMEEQEIVEKIFFPFLATDLLQDAKLLCKMIYESTGDSKNLSSLSKAEYVAWLDKHAPVICPKLIDQAISEGVRMIQLYHSGAYDLPHHAKNDIPSNPAARFAHLDI